MKYTTIRARVSEETKLRVEAYCRENECTESDLVKSAVENALGINPITKRRVEEGRPGKITVRFTDAELAEITRRSEEEGFLHRTDWLVYVVRCYLGMTAMNNDALNLLRESNRGVFAIGRNLNQIVKVLNTDFRYLSSLTPELMEALKKRLDAHFEKVAELIERVTNRF